MQLNEIITIKPGHRGGQPVIRGMRITVYDILKMLASGMTYDEILSDFPELTKEDIHAVLAYASQREQFIITATDEITIRPEHLSQTNNNS